MLPSEFQSEIRIHRSVNFWSYLTFSPVSEYKAEHYRRQKRLLLVLSFAKRDIAYWFDFANYCKYFLVQWIFMCSFWINYFRINRLWYILHQNVNSCEMLGRIHIYISYITLLYVTLKKTFIYIITGFKSFYLELYFSQISYVKLVLFY